MSPFHLTLHLPPPPTCHVTFIRSLCLRTMEALSLLHLLSTNNLPRMTCRLDEGARKVMREILLRDLVTESNGETVAAQVRYVAHSLPPVSLSLILIDSITPALPLPPSPVMSPDPLTLPFTLDPPHAADQRTHIWLLHHLHHLSFLLPRGYRSGG